MQFLYLVKYLFRMKFLSVTTLWLLIAVSFSQNKVYHTPTPKDVTIYLEGAEINNTVKIFLKKGRNEVYLQGLAEKIKPSSVRAQLQSSDIKLLSINLEKDYTQKTKPDSLLQMENDLMILKAEQYAYSTEKDLLIKNMYRIGETGISLEELKNSSAYYREKIKTITLDIKKKDKEVADLNNEINDFKNRNDISYRTKPNAQIKIVLEVEKDINSTFEVSYLSQQVGWLPTYNIKSNGQGSQLELEFLAKIYNKSGLDWNNLPLTISTSDPSMNLTPPDLKVWSLSSRNDSYYEGYTYHKRTKNEYTYDLTYDVGDAEEEEEDLEYNTTGAVSRSAPVKKAARPTNTTYVEVSESGVSYQPKERYKILSDGKVNIVPLANYKTDVTYKYYTVPKMDQNVYLRALLPNWDKYNLVSGPANIFVNNNYMGESEIDINVPSDTLSIYLGIDKKIVVNRVKKEDKSSTKFIGTNRKDKLYYEIEIRNTYDTIVNIDVIDQIPVSKESDIEVTVDNISGAELDELSGKLLWKKQLSPSKTEKLAISFTVKYPKKKKIKYKKNRVAAPKQFW